MNQFEKQVFLTLRVELEHLLDHVVSVDVPHD